MISWKMLSTGLLGTAAGIRFSLCSSHLAEEPLGHLAGEARAVFMGLEQADHGRVHRLRLLS